jgi:hypothetical protein
LDALKRKELQTACKNRAVIGGIYCIRCRGNHRAWLKSTVNLSGQQNKFEFAVSTQSCPEPAMRAEWTQYGASSFSFVVVETLEKKPLQTDQEFLEDLGVLLELWTEKHPEK